MGYGLNLALLEVNGNADGVDPFYILSQDVYEGLETICGVQKVEDPTGFENIVPVKNAIKSTNLLRLSVKLKNGEDIKYATLLVSRLKLSSLFTDDGKSALDGKTVQRAGSTVGTVETVFFPLSRYLIPA